jgi:hypothetical protein
LYCMSRTKSSKSKAFAAAVNQLFPKYLISLEKHQR